MNSASKLAKMSRSRAVTNGTRGSRSVTVHWIAKELSMSATRKFSLSVSSCVHVHRKLKKREGLQ